MAFPGRSYQTTPQAGNPARTEAWALLEAARELSHTKSGPVDPFRAALRQNWRLWTIFQASLLDPACTMPSPIRGNLLASRISSTSARRSCSRSPIPLGSSRSSTSTCRSAKACSRAPARRRSSSSVRCRPSAPFERAPRPRRDDRRFRGRTPAAPDEGSRRRSRAPARSGRCRRFRPLAPRGERKRA